MKNIDFIFIGSAKAGSTWLYNFLMSHSSIFIPEAKDLYFFDRYYHLGVKWYQKQFISALSSQLKGEICHDYIVSNLAAERIYDYSPNSKIIVFYRKHADRSFSHYQYLQRSGQGFKSLSEAIKNEPRIIDDSLVGKHLKKYTRLFPSNNIFVFNFDLLKSDPTHFAALFCKSLNIELSNKSIYQSDWQRRSAQIPKYIAIAKLFKFFANILRFFGFARLVGKAKHNEFFMQFYKFEKKKKNNEDIKTLNTYKDLFELDKKNLLMMDVNLIGFK